jgi:threonine synthase
MTQSPTRSAAKRSRHATKSLALPQAAAERWTTSGSDVLGYNGTDLINPVKLITIASSIAIGNPADGFYVVHAIKESGGWGESVTDEEIVEGIKLLASTEGILTEPARGTEVSVTRKLIQKGRIPRDEPIVISITGNGYKTLEAVASKVEQPYTIKAALKDFDQLYQDLNPPFSQAAGG